MISAIQNLFKSKRQKEREAIEAQRARIKARFDQLDAVDSGAIMRGIWDDAAKTGHE